MNQEVIQQAAREDAWVPKADRVTISTTNMRIDPTMTYKEETYQVIKNSNFYEFKLANKKCLVDVEVFRQALDICPRVPGKEFAKTRGKGSQGKKSADTPKPTSVEVSDESDSEPARKQTGSRRVIKKKVSIFVEDNIIPEPDVALELVKSMSLTEAAEEEAARQVYATHESIKVQQESANAGGSSEGTGTKPWVLDESTCILSTLHEGTGTKLGVPDEVQGSFAAKADVILDWGSKEDNEYFEEENVDEEIDWVYSNEEEKKKDDDDDKSIDIKETNDEETDDEFVRGDEYVQENVDEEMKDAKIYDTGNGDEEITNRAKADVEKTEEVKDDNKKAKLPPSSSSLSVSSGFDNKFLNLSSDKSKVRNLNDTTDDEINSLLDI
ncbi:hypothetical protein Tco_0891829 [Tanacetum coccineum]|uniref:Uncharacterized protein n=1 Tax=Tanacetum coccineum TaxID=301880 RepID=A0ABQ5C612_9ASTR